MGSISTGVGLISNIDYDSLVKQLISLERRPGNVIQARIDQSTEVRNSLQSLSVALVSAKLASSRLATSGSFADRKASSSNNAISVAAGPKATVGSYTFTPKQQVSTQQLLSSGFASRTSTLGNTAPTTISFSRGGFVDTKTSLSTLNGGNGVAAGSIKITNGASSATVDLSGAVTVDDVVNSINGTTGLGVTARADGDKLTLDAGGGAVTVENVGAGTTATDLGLTNLTLNGGVNEGAKILTLGSNLSLSALNDGNGIRTVGGADLRITLDGSTNFDIELDGIQSVGDLLSAIDTQTSGSVTATINNGALQLSGGTTDIAVSSLGGGQAARDLGIEGSGVGTTLTGRNTLGGFSTVLLDSLRGGFNGGGDLEAIAGEIQISGTGAANIDLSAARTLDDVVRGINGASGTTGVTATVNQARNGLTLTRTDGGSFTVGDNSGNLASFLNVSGSSTAGKINSGDLDRKYINENTKLDSLNGGTGISKGKFQIVDGFGNSAIVDLTQEADDTIGDVILEINTRPGLQVSARLNDTGDGILIEKLGGTGNIQVLEQGNGTTAKSLNLLGPANGSGNIDGSFQKDITVETTDTLETLVSKINAAGAGANASILNTGSGNNPFRLNLTSQQSGTKGELLIDTGATSLGFTTISKAKDAVLLYGSEAGATFQLTSSSNQFKDIVPGLTVNVDGVTNTPVNVTVSEDQESVVKAIKSFVDSINSVKSFITDNTKFNSETNQRGTLFTEGTVRTAEARINSLITSALRDTGSSITSLGELGVRFDGTTGQLTFNESTFQSRYASNKEEVERFFGSSSESGFVKQFGEMVDGLTDADGLFGDRLTNLSTAISRQETSLERFNARIDIRQDRLYKEFAALELSLLNIQSQQSALNSLANLAAQTAGQFF